MNPKMHFIALLTYLPSKKGKRTTPVSSGYRPSIKFPFDQGQFTGVQNFVDTDLVFPGDTVTAEITMLDKEYFEGKIYKGLDFDFFEGQNLIGHGIITKLLEHNNEDL